MRGFVPALPQALMFGIICSMRLEAQFTARDNRLYFLDGTECPLEGVPVLEAPGCVKDSRIPGEKVSCVRVPWTLVGTEGAGYDEEFLAEFREWLKALEAEGRFVFVSPVADRVPCSDSEREDFTASFRHCARRIKDTASVIGFAVPREADAGFFRAELFAKHGHYIFFSGDEDVLKDSAVVLFKDS